MTISKNRDDNNHEFRDGDIAQAEAESCLPDPDLGGEVFGARCQCVHDWLPYGAGERSAAYGGEYGEEEKPGRENWVMSYVTMVKTEQARAAAGLPPVARLKCCATCGKTGLIGRTQYQLAPGEEFTEEVALRGRVIKDYCRFVGCAACRWWAYVCQAILMGILVCCGWVVVTREVVVRVRGGGKREAWQHLQAVLKSLGEHGGLTRLGVPLCWWVDPVLGPRDAAKAVITVLMPAKLGATRHMAMGDAVRGIWDRVVQAARKFTRAGVEYEHEWSETGVLETSADVAGWVQYMGDGPEGWAEDVELLAQIADLGQSHRFRQNKRWLALRDQCGARPREERTDLVWGVQIREAEARSKPPALRRKGWAIFAAVARVHRCSVVVLRDGQLLLGDAAVTYAENQVAMERSVQAWDEAEARSRSDAAGPEVPAPNPPPDPGRVWSPVGYVPMPACAL